MTAQSRPPTTTHLLRNHDSKGRQGCSPDTGTGEKAFEPLQVRFFAHAFILELSVHIEEIPSRLDVRVTQAGERSLGILVSTPLHVPPRRFYLT
jgi:hypothetical protein